MVNKYIGRDEDISRLTKIFREEAKDGINKEFTICSSQYKRLYPTAITVYEHPESINKLVEDGFLKILDSWRQVDDKAPGFGGSYVYKILMFANKFREQIDNQQVSTEPVLLKKALPPKEWQLIEKDKKGYLKKEGKILFIFPTDWADKYRYFKLLWNYYDQYVLYKQIYEDTRAARDNTDYPKSGVTKINRNIRSVFIKLREEMKELPISIDIKKGVKLTFKS